MKLKLLCLCLPVMLLFSCSSDPVETLPEPIVEEANVETEVLLFRFETDLEANTFVMEYNVKHTNKSSFIVNGRSKVIFRQVGDSSITTSFVRMDCSRIDAGENCYDTYYNSGELGNPESFGMYGPPNYELVSAYYEVLEE